jgi:hypothetical protein
MTARQWIACHVRTEVYALGPARVSLDDSHDSGGAYAAEQSAAMAEGAGLQHREMGGVATAGVKPPGSSSLLAACRAPSERGIRGILRKR